MIIKTPEELEILREGGRELSAILEELKSAIKAGVRTKELDALAEKLIRANGGVPSFKGYRTFDAASPYPASLCISINDEVVHGIPSQRVFESGDIVGLDIGMKYQGFFTDMAETVAVGKIDKNGEKLIRVTKKALELAISTIKPETRVGDVGEAVQKFAEAEGFGIVRQLVGHGVGAKVHEDPEIPNWGQAGTGPVLKENMVIAIEPMVTEGSFEVYLDKDGWTWKTKDGSRAAHFEHTILVTNNGAEVLTKC
ncbi:MAG: type I methionyl aminopeptidase [bacterium]|nr:type I methionyl aminopeptidase [bacterium]